MKNRLLRIFFISITATCSFSFFYLGIQLGGWWLPVLLFPTIFCGLLALGNLLPTVKEMWKWLD